MTKIAEPSTVAQKWRFKRDLAIYALHVRCQFSQRVLADVFDLPRSRIASIIRETEALREEWAAGRRKSDTTRNAEKYVPRKRNGFDRVY